MKSDDIRYYTLLDHEIALGAFVNAIAKTLVLLHSSKFNRHSISKCRNELIRRRVKIDEIGNYLINHANWEKAFLMASLEFYNCIFYFLRTLRTTDKFDLEMAELYMEKGLDIFRDELW